MQVRTLAEVISDIVKSGASNTEKVQALTAAVDTFVDLFVAGGVTATRNADEVATAFKSINPEISSSGDAVIQLKKALENAKNNPNPVFAGITFDQVKHLDAANIFKNVPGVADADGPLLKMSQGNGVASYVELVTTKNLQDSGHTVIRFNEKVQTSAGELDIDSLTSFGGTLFANQAKAELADAGKVPTITNIAKQMDEWMKGDPSNSQVGQFVLADASLIHPEVWDSIKGVNPSIRIIDVDGNDVPRP